MRLANRRPLLNRIIVVLIVVARLIILQTVLATLIAMILITARNQDLSHARCGRIFINKWLGEGRVWTIDWPGFVPLWHFFFNNSQVFKLQNVLLHGIIALLLLITFSAEVFANFWLLIIDNPGIFFVLLSIRLLAMKVKTGQILRISFNNLFVLVAAYTGLVPWVLLAVSMLTYFSESGVASHLSAPFFEFFCSHATYNPFLASKNYHLFFTTIVTLDFSWLLLLKYVYVGLVGTDIVKFLYWLFFSRWLNLFLIICH